MKIAVNKSIVGKPDSNDKLIHGRITTSYENVDITPAQLASLVQKGHAFCAQHKNQRRKSANFTACDFLTVDIDDDMTLEQAQENDFVQSYASFIYTTASHSENFHHFRIVFALEKTITNSQQMKNMYTGLAVMFGGDRACVDACRQFYGSKDCELFFFNKTLPERKLTNLLLLAAESKSHVSSTGSGYAGNKSVIRSEITVDIDTSVIDDAGTIHRMGDTTPGMRVLCPIHNDVHASAFVVQSTQGVLGIHCTTCQATYFTSNGMPFYDFNYDLRNLRQLPVERVIDEHTEGPLVYETRSLQILNQQYLEAVDIDTSFVFVKSPKGSGKTQWLEHIVKQAKKDRRKNKKQDKGPRLEDKCKGVLLIGHRQSLITALAERLGLKSYADFPSENGTAISFNQPSEYYAICADSLSIRLDTSRHKYSTVIIDEVEQVLTHLTQATVKDKRNETFLYFKHYLNVAKKVYLMDADLNQLTVNTVHDMVDDKKKSTTVIINDYKPPARSISLYKSELHLVHDMVQDALAGKKLYVCSNSKKQIQRLHMSLIDECSDNLKTLVITSRNSSTPEIQQFIRQIKTEIKNYDVVLASPSMGTGVDISFPYDEQYIDVVYGFFQARVNTHFDMDQQLGRVRHPRDVRVWVTPENFRFETDALVIQQEIKNSMYHARKLIGIKDDGTPEYDCGWDGKYLDLYANVKSTERGSKNKLLQHFIKMKKIQGWEIKEVSKDDESADKGSAIQKASKEAVNQERIEKTLNAKHISAKEYLMLINKSETFKLTSDQEWAMRRHQIETFYMQRIDQDLLELDNDGKYRQSIRDYEYYTQDESTLVKLDVREIKKGLHITDRKNRIHSQKLLFKLLQSAGLADGDQNIIPDHEIHMDELAEFVKLCKRRRNELARLFTMDINRDIDQKPTSQLSKVIKLIGLSWKKRALKIEGRKLYLYAIPQSHIDQIEQYVQRRSDEDYRDNWREEYNKIDENRLFNSEFEAISLQFSNQVRRI